MRECPYCPPTPDAFAVCTACAPAPSCPRCGHLQAQLDALEAEAARLRAEVATAKSWYRRHGFGSEFMEIFPYQP